MLKHENLKMIEDSVEKVVLLSQKKNIKCEVSASVNLGLSVNVRMQDLDLLEFNNNKKLYITVYVGQNQSTVSTTELDLASLNDVIDKAISIAKFTDPDPYAGLADPHLMVKKIIDLDLYHPEPKIDSDFAIKFAKNCEKIALEQPNIENSEGAAFSYNSSCIAVGNSNNFFGSCSATSYSLSCTAIAGNGVNMQRDFDFTCARSFKNLINFEVIGKRSAIYAAQRLGAKKIKGGRSKVLFMPEVASELIGYLVDAILGCSIANNSSFLLNKLNHKIFPEFISIIDDPLLPQGLSSASFDYDGLATKKQFIVADGVLNTYLLNNYFAKKLKLKPTGHANGIHNLFLIDVNKNTSLQETYSPVNNIIDHKKQQDKIEKCTDLIKQMNTGLIVTETIGNGVNIVTGDYSKGIFGFWVENGQIIYPVEETTIAANLNDMFKNILAVNQDFNIQNNIITGSILIDDITIAGT